MKRAWSDTPGWPMGRLARMAKHRLVNGGPEMCSRIEDEAVLATKRADWSKARRLLHLRLEMRPTPTFQERVRIDRFLKLIDEAEARGLGPRI